MAKRYAKKFRGKRQRLPRGKSRQMFRKGAQRVVARNFAPRPMRGGIRL